MNLRKLLEDDDAVSPVIGVILMVAITVILAAVIASFVLGLGDTADEVQPTSSLSFDFDDETNNLTIQIADGDSITAENLYIRGEMTGNETGNDNGISEDIDVTFADAIDGVFGDSSTSGFDATGVGGYGANSDEISASQGIEISAINTTTSSADTAYLTPYDIDIVWDTGDDSATLDGDDREP